MRNRRVILALLIAVVAGIAVLPVLVLMGAFWLSDRTHEFGPADPRYVLLIRGTLVDQLGLIAPVSGSIRYSARGNDGNSPAHAAVSYATMQQPTPVRATYRSRCQAQGLTIDAKPSEPHRIACDGPRGDAIGIEVEARSDGATAVRIGGWVF